MNITNFLFTLLILAFIAGGTMLYRNTMVYNFRTQALHIVDERGTKAINEGREWTTEFAPYDAWTHDDMMYDFTKWSFESFYPTLTKEQ